MSLAIASRYARALVDAVTAPASGIEPRAAGEQLRSVVQMVTESAELRNVLLSPAVASTKKRAVIGRLAPGLSLAGLIKNFLFVVIDHRRTGMLKEILESFETQLDERLGVVRADVVTAKELTAAQRQALQAELSRLTQKQVRMEVSPDESLLAGITVRIGSTVYDSSVRGQLETLRRQLVSE